MSRRACVGILFALLCIGLPGCGLMQSARKMSSDSLKMFKPNPNGYGSNDSSNPASTEWSGVGNVARNIRPKESDSDPLRYIMLDPKSIEIERSLGIE
ncbi:MAG: hypothetical protein NT013_24825 [Planctomycetia bacterium]|nr:hypothetical protein [Planctomycetia bacterium]